MKVDSLANKVYNELRKKILSNQLVSGTRLKEDIWAKRLDVNRMAVREALTRLLGEQLIETGEKGGYFVKSMSVEELLAVPELKAVAVETTLEASSAMAQRCISKRFSGPAQRRTSALTSKNGASSRV